MAMMMRMIVVIVKLMGGDGDGDNNDNSSGNGDDNTLTELIDIPCAACRLRLKLSNSILRTCIVRGKVNDVEGEHGQVATSYADRQKASNKKHKINYIPVRDSLAAPASCTAQVYSQQTADNRQQTEDIT
jgi:hypothetical protein